jgi:hypothetical protein
MEESKNYGQSDENSDHYNDGFDDEDLPDSPQILKKEHHENIDSGDKSDNFDQYSNDQNFENIAEAENPYSNHNLDIASHSNRHNTESEEAKMQPRNENNNSSLNKKPINGKIQKLDYEDEEIKLNTHNYFHPNTVKKSFNRDSAKFGNSQSPRFEGEKSNDNDTSKSLISYPEMVKKPATSHSIGRDEISEYTREEMHGFKTVFNTFDKDNSGHVSINDLKTIFGSLQRSPEELETILEELGLNECKDDD